MKMFLEKVLIQRFFGLIKLIKKIFDRMQKKRFHCSVKLFLELDVGVAWLEVELKKQV